MKSVHVPKVHLGPRASFDEISGVLGREGVGVALDEVPWGNFPYKPAVAIRLGHAGQSIFLEYQVREQAVLAEKTEPNSPVSRDSCVEFFVAPYPAPAGDGLYYNFEFNCIGTCLVGVGTGRHGRDLLEPAIISTIRRRSSLGSAPFGERREATDWNLVVAIPLSVFTRHAITDITGMRMSGNLYKCGDDMSVPHYVTWNTIQAPSPDYHLPEHFGRLIFSS